MSFLWQMVAGMQQVHAAGILHRDLKPANLLLVGDTLKIADLGCCKMIDDLGRGWA